MIVKRSYLEELIKKSYYYVYTSNIRRLKINNAKYPLFPLETGGICLSVEVRMMIIVGKVLIIC